MCHTVFMSVGSPPTRHASDLEAAFSTFNRRWNQIWVWLPFLLLGISFATSIFATEVDSRDLLVISILTLVLFLWHIWFIVLHPKWPAQRLTSMVIYFCGLLTLAFVLTVRAEPFVLVLTGCYVMAFVAIPGRWAYLGVGLTGIGLLLSIGVFPPNLPVVAQIAGSSVLAAVVGWAMRWVESEAFRQKQAHAELLAVTTELQRTNENKDVLQRQLSAAARASGVASERARLAREFHDTLAQGLAGISAQLENADAQIAEHHPAGPRVKTALELSRSSLTEARRSVLALRPGPLSASSFATAFHETVRAWQQQHEIPLRVDLAGIVEPDDEKTQIALLRFLQEGLANVARHAAASEATLTVSGIGDQLIIDIFDDGVGFDPNALGPGDSQGGFGLVTARERLKSVGADLSIESSPESGTTITAIVALHQSTGGVS